MHILKFFARVKLTEITIVLTIKSFDIADWYAIHNF